MQTLLGVDTGGTFTDFVLLRNGQIRIHKVLSTPHAPEQAILQGIAELGLAMDDLHIVHGSTVATNALLEGKGARVAYVTNSGFADVLTIGRQARQALYDLQPAPVLPPVPAESCFEVPVRIAADGQRLKALNADKLNTLVNDLQAMQPAAVAINFLFSWVNDHDERTVATAVQKALPAHCFVTCSADVLPEIKEYERGMATWLNAYVGPKVQGYLQRLVAQVSPASLAVMQSNGMAIDAKNAAQMAVNLLLSGPAGGLAGALLLGQQSQYADLLTFDMGGTSTDVAMLQGRIPFTSEGRISHYSVAVPMVDMHTIGAGGGSIAWLDSGGVLQVGPESAGAAPGPACYGNGGTKPTVTDANVVLGRLPAAARLGGHLQLSLAAAQAALQPLANALQLSLEQVAQGIVDVANEHMSQALRVMSVQRGYDPRQFALMCFGGAGGLHVCALAETLDMAQAMVPIHGGVLSALGMLAAQPGRQYSQSILQLLADVQPEQLQTILAELQAQAEGALAAEGWGAEQLHCQHSADVRYQGQSFTLNVPLEDMEAAFHALHLQRYGHQMALPLELVNLRVQVTAPAVMDALPAYTQGAQNPTPQWVAVADPTAGSMLDVPMYNRAELAAGVHLAGPALIAEQVSTTWLAPGWHAVVDGVGNLLLERPNK